MAFTDIKQDDYAMRNEYILDFEATMVLTTGYDAVRRAAVVDRWMQLEEIVAAPVQPQFHIPQIYAEAMRLAADQADENQMLTQKSAMLTIPQNSNLQH